MSGGLKDRKINLTEKEKEDLEPRRNILKGILLLSVILMIAVLIRVLVGSQAEAAGRWIVEEFGYVGVFLSVLILDTLIQPISPDVVIFIAIAGDMNPLGALFTMATASMIAGHLGYLIGRFLGHRKFVQNMLGKNLDRGHYLAEKYGMGAVILGAVTPIPFSTVCWLAGMMEMKYSKFLVAVLYRIPRFLLWYLIIGLGFISI
ncbi:MAG: YqaA family protein [Thermoplasmatota archaeon]